MSVDDDMVNQVVAEQILRLEKTWRVVKAFNGPQCLELIESQPDLPDIILLDIMVGGLGIITQTLAFLKAAASC